MLFNLTELFLNEGFKKELSVKIPIKKIEFAGMSNEIVDGVLVNITLIGITSNKVAIEGNTVATLNIACSRCMENVVYPIKTDFSKELKFNEESDESYSYIIGYHIDLEGLALDELTVNLPMKVLCADNCMGICEQCGINLNKDSCNCNKDIIDPRLAGLKDLFNDFKEV